MISCRVIGTAILYFAAAFVATRFARIRWQLALILILLPLAFTGRALLTGRVYAPIDLPYGAEPLNWMKEQYGVGNLHNGLLSDVFSHNIPWKYAVRDAYAHGELPLWNPHIFAGDILAAAAQPAAYDPLLLLSLLLPLPNSLTFLASLSLFIAGLGMYLLLRDLYVSELASLAGAAAFMFSTFIAFWLEWPLGATTVWLPLLILGVRRVVREQTLRSAALLTFVFVMMLLAGHPETALHLVSLGAAWAVAELWAVRRFVKPALLAIGAGVVALLVCAIYLLPVMDALPQTFEHELRRTLYVQMKKSAPLPLAMAKLESQLVPFIHGMPHREWPENLKFEPPLESAYCGSAALALAAFGAWRSRSRAKWVALAFILGGLLFGARVWPLPDLLGKLPLFDVALNDRLVVAAAFGIAILAALGLDAFDRRALMVTSIITAALLALACANAWPRMLGIGLTPQFVRGQAVFLVGGALVVSLIATTARARALLFVAIVAQRVIEAGSFYPTLPAKMFYPPIPVFEKLPKTGEPYRIAGQMFELIPNSATLYGLEDVRGYQALRLKRWKETLELYSIEQGVWWSRVEDLNAPFLSLLNVRYALQPWTVKTIPPGWRKVAEQPGTNLLENTRVLGRAFVPRTVRLGDQNALLQMRLARDFSERAWIDAQTTVPRDEVNGPGRARVERSARGKMRIRASMAGGGWVVISETAWKGWRAYVDGKRAPLRYANHTLLAVYVPQGEHTITMQYLPQSFVIGAWISGITVLLLLGIGIAWRFFFT
ncbi:MAG TPA: YfhO family protein [Thermoanaerobaculia bacterium]|nr:YfhO family protein [Thermoanaerobaculia bacterium]